MEHVTKFRLTHYGSSIKLGSKGECKAMKAKRGEEADFDTREQAKAALELAIELARKEYAALFKPGEAIPLMTEEDDDGFGSPSRDPRASSPKAMRWLALKEDVRVSAFEAPLPLERRMGLPSLWVVVSEDGQFIRLGQSGWVAFDPDLRKASFFATADEAAEILSGGGATQEAAKMVGGARLVELGLSMKASLDPSTRKASLNSATGLMGAIKEGAEIREGAPSGAAPAKVGASKSL